MVPDSELFSAPGMDNQGKKGNTNKQYIPLASVGKGWSYHTPNSGLSSQYFVKVLFSIFLPTFLRFYYAIITLPPLRLWKDRKKRKSLIFFRIAMFWEVGGWGELTWISCVGILHEDYFCISFPENSNWLAVPLLAKWSLFKLHIFQEAKARGSASLCDLVTSEGTS